MEYLLGIDVGTSGARATIISDDAKIVKACEVFHDFRTPKIGWAEQEAEVYWNSFCKVVSMVLEHSGIETNKIAGIGISALTPDCLPIDEGGKPLAPAILWLDRRATKESEWLKSRLNEDEVLRMTGNGIDPYFGLVKLLWLKNNLEELYEKAHKFINIKDFIVGRLTGKFVSDYSDAALWGIAFDIMKKRWNGEVLHEIGLSSDKLPALYKSDEVIGSVTLEASSIIGIPSGIPVVAGAPDGFANLVSMGVVDIGDSGMSLGTSGVWGVLHKGNTFAKEIVTCPSASNPEIFVSFAALAISGGVHKWFKNNIATSEAFLGKALSFDPYELMDAQAKLSPPGARGLIVLPYFMGERTPVWDPNARGVIFGLSIMHDRKDLYRAALEGIAYAFLDNWEIMKKMGIKSPPKVKLSGGGSKSDLLRRILADVLGMPMVLLKNVGGAETGDAFIAGKGVGIFESYEQIKRSIQIEEETSPNYFLNHRYRNIYTNVYRKLYPALKGVFSKSAEITKF